MTDIQRDRKQRSEFRAYLGGAAFRDRKVTDTPTDDLSAVNRKYANLNGDTASRPNPSVVGQQYFDTDDGYPVFADGSNWVSATGSVVG